MAPFGVNHKEKILFNLKSFNELKKDQTNIKIFKNSSFDSSFNSVQSSNTNLYHIQHLPSNWQSNLPLGNSDTLLKEGDCDLAQGGKRSRCNKNIRNPKLSAILRAIRSIQLNRNEWKLIRNINLMEKKIRSSPLALPLRAAGIVRSYAVPALAQSPSRAGAEERVTTSSFISADSNKIFTYNKIISKNILLGNMKYNFLKSTLSTILKKKIRKISEVLKDKPIKNYVLYSYLKNCIFSPPHLNGGRTKLSLNKYKGRKFGSFINYNKIIGYKFNSTFYQAASTPLPLGAKQSLFLLENKAKQGASAVSFGEGGVLEKSRGNLYIKDTYKLLFYLFKSMYCLISKPVLKYTNDKVTIQLFYYLNIPKKKVFRLFSIFYINSIKKKWLAAKATQHHSPLLGPTPPSHPKGLALGRGRGSNSHTANSFLGRTFLPPIREGNPKIYIRWKLRKAISRFKNKNTSINLLFKLRKFNLTAKAVFQNKLKLICTILSNKFNKPVELQLIRLHHPYHDSNILVNLLSLNIKNKRKKARVAIQKIYNKKPVKNLNDPNLKSGKLLPAFLSGLNIKIAGRLMGEPIIPRITTKVFGKGASATGKVNYLDVARITKKNRKGAYTLKITSGQNFF